MKLNLVIFLLIPAYYSWQSELKILQTSSSSHYDINYRLRVTSDMGSKASTSCMTNSKGGECQNSKEALSDKGGYVVRDLNCSGLNCTYLIYCDYILFNMEVECKANFNHTETNSKNSIHEQCNYNRRFTLQDNGEVAYEN
ncbi:hypothetical protein CONCODRAFT_4355 [Conidiobolus coronatus NRRL 28638]|uniref:Secreted protein n=1 Tax=Conidiobolus coronatus (strain ATCC 28846 / CBS 209.66 / NRRL 28638) TaxID=796925 RepID=A0A137PCN5_CONC2|nr:hypothetical protein CONCODRAFT_4355 [Conidiobolus coronatus NRRL 28638]|eukprot:KXN72750.1 hypothetical protein CONCODRAFT_4355 [Conidiobolus coronatus NRRL 28638]